MARVDDLGCGGSGDEHATDHEVGRADRVLHVVAVRSKRMQAAVVEVVELAQPVQVDVDDGDVRAHAERDLGRVGADDASADDAYIARRRAGTPPSSTPRPPRSFSRYVAPTCTLMRPATSLIGISNGSAPEASRTVSYAMPRDFVVEERIGQLFQRSEVQIGEQDEPRAKVPVLFLSRLLDLDDHAGEAPYVVGRAHDLRSGGLIGIVRKGRKRARAGFDQHGVPGLHQRLDARPGVTPTRLS